MSGDRDGVYLAYGACGCVAVIISDVTDDRKWTSGEVADCVRKGYRIQRYSEEEYQSLDTKTLVRKCPHNPRYAKQGELFA
jgi:hypothetical protein